MSNAVAAYEVDKGAPKEVVHPKQWQLFIGVLSDGGLVGDAIRDSGISRYQLEGAIRTSEVARSQYEEAKLTALRKAWDMETVERVMVRLAMCEKGGILKKILEDELESPASFYRLLVKDPIVKEMYDEARKIQAEVMADDIIQISDDGSNDTYTDEKGRRRIDTDVIQRSRERISTRKWVMSKLHWQRFGDKIEQKIDATITVDTAARLVEARKRKERLVNARRIAAEPATEPE